MSEATGAADVTTVVMTRERWSDLKRSLPRHAGAVIVVDNGSRDGSTERIRAAFPEVTVVGLARNLGAVARNIGVEAATTPYVAFADDDSWWAAGALERATALLDADPRLAVLAGRVLVGEEGRLDPTCAAMAASPLGSSDAGPTVLGFVACGAVVRRDAFLAVGGFDPVLGWPGEEELLALRLATAGYRCAYAADVVAHHHPSATRPPTLRRRALEERNDFLTAVLTRPWPIVARTAASRLRGDTGARLGLLWALLRAPRALRHRSVLPPDVEAARRLLG
jgi:GT2 family glycosyltransferase